MSALTLSGLPPAAPDDHLANFCAAIPSALAVSGDLQETARALEQLVRLGKGHALPLTSKKSRPDPFASLWFIQAADHFAKAGGEAKFFNDTLLTQSKKILQDFIAANGIGEVKMDDGGLLLTPEPRDALRLNTLWYSALEVTAVNLKAANDRVSDHFERLAGRFRRSFAKSFWCEQHAAICPPRVRSLPDHGAIPDPDQILLTLLPASPVPRTKQRQVLQLCKAKSLGKTGILYEHPEHGVVESALHRAWLALGMHQTADNPALIAADLAEVLAPLQGLVVQAKTQGLPAFYKAGSAEPVAGQKADLHTTATVLAALKLSKNG